MMQRTIDGENLPAGMQWREGVYAFQRKGEFSPTLGKIASEFAGGAQVRLANPDIPAERRVIDHVLDACEFRDISNIPPIAIVDAKMINAASIGGKMIVFTTGIMNKLPDEQLRAVAGHEMSHHRHAMRDLSVLATIGLTSHVLINEVKFGSKTLLEHILTPFSRLSRNALVPIATVAATMLTALPFTPWRWHMERESDREGADFVGAKQMADALESLERESHKPRSEKPMTFGRRCIELLKKALGILLFPFSTHPPLDSRIEEMRQRATAEAVNPFVGSAPSPAPAPIMNTVPGPAPRVYTQATDYQDLLEQQATPALSSHTA